MTNYFTIQDETNIFKNMNYLDPECIPHEFHHRDHELATIASNIIPIKYGSMPLHTIILGDNATGKTTAIKKLFQQVTEEITETLTCYINCRKQHTEYQIYRELYQTVIGKPAPERGSNSQKIFTDTMKKLEITRQPLLVALDDANYLLGTRERASPHSQNVIRNLTRANESYNTIIGIYPIITSKEFQYKFEREVNTLFTPYEVHFKPYTEEQYKDIITQRCKHAFNTPPNPETIDKIVQKINKTKNIRQAWTILKKYGINRNMGLTETEAINNAFTKTE